MSARRSHVVLLLLVTLAASCSRPNAIVAEPEPPAAPPATVTVAGTLTDEGVECPALRAADGRLYTLLGEVDAPVGAQVRVRGREVEISFCQQGTTLQVDEVVVESTPSP